MKAGTKFVALGCHWLCQCLLIESTPALAEPVAHMRDRGEKKFPLSVKMSMKSRSQLPAGREDALEAKAPKLVRNADKMAAADDGREEKGG